MEQLTISEAAQLCRQTIQEGFEEWAKENSNTGNVLLFCLISENFAPEIIKLEELQLEPLLLTRFLLKANAWQQSATLLPDTAW